MVKTMGSSEVYKKAIENNNYVFFFNVLIAAQVALGVSGFDFGIFGPDQRTVLGKMEEYAKREVHEHIQWTHLLDSLGH